MAIIKLKDLLRENEEEEPIDKNKLFNSDSYLDDAAEKFGWKRDFNEDFWRFPFPLFHCTPPENEKAIFDFGLSPKNKTRGITNRGIVPSVFTTMAEEEVESLKQSYGKLVVQINTKKMKEDGYMPEVAKEPEWERAHKLAFVFQKIGESEQYSQPDRFVDSSDGVSDYTVIVFGKIPAKYLSLSHD